jgi:hypothetical protein
MARSASPRSSARRATGARALALALAGAAPACGTDTISAVDPPVGFYVPRSDCVTREGGGTSCPSGAQFAFERASDHLGFILSKPSHQTQPRVSCARTFCGTGAFAYHARYSWRRGTSSDSAERYHDIRYEFSQPVEMKGKTLTAHIFVDKFDTPLNAQLAIIQYRGRYRIIFDGPIFNARGWNTIGGIVGPENPKAFSAGETVPASVAASELVIAVYLSTDVRSGDRETWESDIYFDEIGWK